MAFANIRVPAIPKPRWDAIDELQMALRLALAWTVNFPCHGLGQRKPRIQKPQGAAFARPADAAPDALAGRIEYVPLGPFDLIDLPPAVASTIKLWVHGGFPDSILAATAKGRKPLRGEPGCL